MLGACGSSKLGLTRNLWCSIVRLLKNLTAKNECSSFIWALAKPTIIKVELTIKLISIRYLDFYNVLSNVL